MSYKATLENPWNKIKEMMNEKVILKIKNITDKAIFDEIKSIGLTGMLHYKEISYQENFEDLKKFKR